LVPLLPTLRGEVAIPKQNWGDVQVVMMSAKLGSRFTSGNPTEPTN
jgi:hypothetical protein